jgi:hypothetical protein
VGYDIQQGVEMQYLVRLRKEGRTIKEWPRPLAWQSHVKEALQTQRGQGSSPSGAQALRAGGCGCPLLDRQGQPASAEAGRMADPTEHEATHW